MNVVTILFWSSVAIIVYTYGAFPLIVFLRARIRSRPHRSAEITPTVSMIIVAHNEEEAIEAKLENVLSLDYPRELMEVIVASDGSNDRTEEIVRGFERRGIQLLALPRQGKIPALNTAVSHATGDILVFSDANSIYAPDAIRALTRPFADPEVGGVAGDQRYLDEKTQNNVGERQYWSLDRKLKQWQTAAGNAISATGAIYAIRRFLFQPVPKGVTDDFTASTGVIAQGYRLVFSPEAIAYEPAAANGRMEFGRKARVITRGLCAVLARRELLDPRRYGFYSVQLFSHKVLRRLVVYPFLVLLATSALAWPYGLIYQAAFLAQAAFYVCAAIGAILEGRRLGHLKVFSLPYFFCMVYYATLLASIRVLRGQRIDLWEPQRREPSAQEVAGPAVGA